MKDIKNYKKLLLELMHFDTQNFDDKVGHDTLPLLNYVKKRLDKKKIKCKIHKYSVPLKFNGRTYINKNRANLIADIKIGDKPYILLQGHVDTVPFDGKINKFNPLGEEKGDFIIGRGAVDMKGGITSIISAVEELSENKNLNNSLLLLLTSDEEANNLSGIRNFIKLNRKKIILAISAEPTNLNLMDKLYGAIYMRIKILSRGLKRNSHQKNAIENIIPVLSNLLDFKEKALKIANRHFGKTIVNIGKINGGLKVNNIPEECCVEFLIRNVFAYKKYLSLLKNIVINKINTFYKFEVVFKYNPAVVRLDEKINNRILKILKESNMKTEKKTMKALTEATILNNNGIPTLIFGPGDLSLSHGASDKERIKITDIVKAKNFYKNLFQN